MAEQEYNSTLKNFCDKYLIPREDGLIHLSIEDINELKANGITLENLLEYIVTSTGMLMHGSIYQILNGELNSKIRKIFATNSPTIAILKSIFSNRGIKNLSYPRNLSSDRPFYFEIQTLPGQGYTSVDRGFIYLVSPEGFEQNPESNYELINESDSVKIKGIIEVSKDDFIHPFKVTEVTLD